MTACRYYTKFPQSLQGAGGRAKNGWNVSLACVIILRMNTRILKPDFEGVCLAGQVLKNGGIAAFPTDTVYGLGALFYDAGAVRKIFEAKGRPEEKPLSILICEKEQVRLLAEEISDTAKILMDRFWPGALTLIFRKKADAMIPEEVTRGYSTIGIRLPDSDVAFGVIKAAGAPVAAPSANISGRRSAACLQDVVDDLDGRVDLILDGGNCPVGVSSTVLDLSREHLGEIRILREGTITRRMIEEAIERALCDAAHKV